MGNQTKRKYYETEDFKALNAQWQKKLKKSGFQDAECLRNGEYYLNEFTSASRLSPSLRDNELGWKSKEEYYRLAGHFLHSFQFESKRDRVIWEMHTEGATSDKIAKALKKHKVTITPVFVREIVRNLAKEMLKPREDHEEDECNDEQG